MILHDALRRDFVTGGQAGKLPTLDDCLQTRDSLATGTLITLYLPGPKKIVGRLENMYLDIM